MLLYLRSRLSADASVTATEPTFSPLQVETVPVWLKNGTKLRRHSSGALYRESAAIPVPDLEQFGGRASLKQNQQHAVSQTVHASSALPLARSTGGAWNHDSGNDSTFAHANID